MLLSNGQMFELLSHLDTSRCDTNLSGISSVSTRCWLLLSLWESVIVLCFVVHYFVSIPVLQSSRWERERAGCFALFVLLVSHDCCVALLHDATGLSAVCDCGIS